MIIWKNLIKNLIITVCNFFFTGLLFYIELKNSKSKEGEFKGLIILINFLLFFFFNSMSFYLIFNSPCYLKPHKMTTKCVACWEDSITFGIKCENCKNVALCINCYNMWKRKGNNCPLCREYYVV